eukprot:superscaffoldBa00014290_g26303
MVRALNLLLTGCLLQGALCRELEVFMPDAIDVLSGSCVTIPCSFDIMDEYDKNLDHTSLTWTPSLGHSRETLQENEDKTKVMTSVLTFTASHLHHGKEISCTAAYNKQDGSTGPS